MGYRSQVIIVLSKEAMAYATVKNNLPAAFAEADKHATHEEGYYWRFDSWKWYDGYPIIDEVTRFLHELDEYNDSKQDKVDLNTYVPMYGFIRIGEELEDIETKGDPGHFDVWVSRTFDCPGAIALEGDN
jgi:hypothetical protein